MGRGGGLTIQARAMVQPKASFLKTQTQIDRQSCWQLDRQKAYNYLYNDMAAKLRKYFFNTHSTFNIKYVLQAFFTDTGTAWKLTLFQRLQLMYHYFQPKMYNLNSSVLIGRPCIQYTHCNITIVDTTMYIFSYYTISMVQGDQLFMVVFLWHLVKGDLSRVRFCKRVHWSSHFLQGTRNTRLCLTGHPVYRGYGFTIIRNARIDR